MDSVIKLNVPEKIRYISEWKGFNLFDFTYILNKQIPGCGFTEWCIGNNMNVVLCSPRRILLENKEDQHKGEVFYVRNEREIVLDLDKDLTKVSKPNDNPADDSVQDGELYQQIGEKLSNYIYNRSISGKPIKILVTYDSFCIVKNLLLAKGILQTFNIVVDEFQSIFTDSRFKSDVELKFVSQLKDLQKVCFVSATPMIREYLDMLDEFKNLPYYELDWSALNSGRLKKPSLIIRYSRSIYESAKNIINLYKSGNFEYKYIKEGDIVRKIVSKEAVIYVNSVNNIIGIIKRTELKPDQVNILCARTPNNISKIEKRLGKGFDIGRVPLKGEPHKMFTFCTRTVYLGADFYSTNARTFILSDANIETLAVDISMDLPQILGRQRLNENPWKNYAEFYYKPLIKKGMNSRESFEKLMQFKKSETENVINFYYKSHANSSKEERESTIRFYQRGIAALNYRNDYVSLSWSDSVNEYVPVFNSLVMIAEKRAFDIQQIDYADRFSVFSNISNILGLEEDYEQIKKILGTLREQTTLYDKLKFLCNVLDQEIVNETILLDQINEKHFAEYFKVLGVDRIRALGYNVTCLNKELGILSFDKSQLKDLIYSTFIPGNSYLYSDIKSKLKDIYSKCGYQSSAKAVDLEKYFKVISVNINIGNGKRSKGYKIIEEKK